MTNTEGTETQGTENTGAETTEKTFTQAELDQVVRDRVNREKAKYADYDELKSKADGAKTVEQQLADLTARHAATEARALRSDVAARHGISAEDRDLFLTGTDEETLEAQAKRLAERDSDRKMHGNTARREGTTKQQNGKATSDMRDFTRQLFGDTD